MSNYTAPAINPDTKKIEQAEFLDNHFGHRQYGVRFPSSDKIQKPNTYKDHYHDVLDFDQGSPTKA